MILSKSCDTQQNTKGGKQKWSIQSLEAFLLNDFTVYMIIYTCRYNFLKIKPTWKSIRQQKRKIDRVWGREHSRLNITKHDADDNSDQPTMDRGYPCSVDSRHQDKATGDVTCVALLGELYVCVEGGCRNKYPHPEISVTSENKNVLFFFLNCWLFPEPSSSLQMVDAQ